MGSHRPPRARQASPLHPAEALCVESRPMTAADVSVVTETLPGSQVGLTIEVPSEQVDRAFERVFNRLSQRVRIEGFRPGRAPRPLIEARLGAAAIRDEVVETLVPTLVTQALRDHSIEAIDRPTVEG